ncbi:MAG: DNA helicase RecG, partial [Candidatus Cloacimonetes bacterium]|nr:DNA helicase RecG [Candidatus Cloacimonadota bacterium]
MNPLSSEIQYLKGVGEKRAIMLNKLGINTILDMIEYFPRDYINRAKKQAIRDLIIGENAAVIGEIVAIETKRMDRVRSQLHVIISDEEDYLLCTWFHYSKWIIKKFEDKKKIWVSGIVTEFQDTLQIVHPEIEFLDEGDKQDFWHSRTVLPVYSL